jgi:predicted DNA-binding transcriptional regulator AlpA
MPTQRKQPIPTTQKRQRVFERQFITAKDLAQRWGLSKSAVYHGNSDVSLLRRIPFGKKSVRFLLSQVEEVEQQKLSLET